MISRDHTVNSSSRWVREEKTTAFGRKIYPVANRALSVVSLWQVTVPAIGRVTLSPKSVRVSTSVGEDSSFLGGGGKATGPTQEATAVC